VRRRKGLLALLLLGIAYGIYEEGIVVHSFFNPDWGELGDLARYGYAGGVNWTWSELMAHFHTFISIGASVILAELIYPERRREPWLGTRGLAVCGIGLAAWAPAGLLLTDYFPPAGWYLASWAAVAGLVAGAALLPALPLPNLPRNVPHPLFFLLLGLVNMTAWFLAVFLTPDTSIPLAVTATGLLAVDGVTLWLLARWSGNGHRWDDRHRLALVAGLLGFFVFFCFAKDVEAWHGTSLVGLLAIGGLLLLWRKVKSQGAKGEGEDAREKSFDP
jgi:MFS family permease